jgi:hypothetical protein
MKEKNKGNGEGKKGRNTWSESEEIDPGRKKGS